VRTTLARAIDKQYAHGWHGAKAQLRPGWVFSGIPAKMPATVRGKPRINKENNSDDFQ
jgi:hypothetical protein